MRIIRTTQHADTILTAARKGIQSQLEQLTSPDAKFQSGFEHQPIAQSGARKKRLRKLAVFLSIPAWDQWRPESPRPVPLPTVRSCLETERQLEVSETSL